MMRSSYRCTNLKCTPFVAYTPRSPSVQGHVLLIEFYILTRIYSCTLCTIMRNNGKCNEVTGRTLIHTSTFYVR